MVFLVAAEQCGEQFSVLRADRRLELAYNPVKMEREMCILAGFLIYPHLFRCLILAGNSSRGVSPPSDHSAESSSLPSGLACLPSDTTDGRERFTARQRSAETRKALEGLGPSLRSWVRASNAPTALLGASRRAGRRSCALDGGPYAGQSRTRTAEQGRCGTFSAQVRRPVVSLKRHGTNLNAPVDLEAVEFPLGKTATVTRRAIGNLHERTARTERACRRATGAKRP
jgi:hypothetical protein